MREALDQLENYVDWSASFMKPNEYEPAEIALAKVSAFVRFVSESESVRILRSEEYTDYVTAALIEWRSDYSDPKKPTLRPVP